MQHVSGAPPASVLGLMKDDSEGTMQGRRDQQHTAVRSRALNMKLKLTLKGLSPDS